MISAALIFGLAFTSCSDDDNNDDLSCEDAVSATIEAGIAFNASTSANYATLCANYKAALEAQIDSCGDENGDLQAMIDDLGDCTLDSGGVMVTVGTLQKNFNSNVTVTLNGTTRHIRAEDAATDDYIEFDIEQGATGADAISNFNIHLLTSDYNPLPDDEGGDWMSNITTNSATEINGTFSGIVTSPTSGADLGLTSGLINIDL